jgi:hypothetical protein
MVEVRYRGSFAENLFQYSFGRLLAERWGHELNALPLPHFPATAEPVKGRRFLSPFFSWGGMAAEERQLSTLMRGENLTQPVHGRLVLFGWFQRWEYYRGHEEELRRWLAVEQHPDPAGEDDFAICIRTRRPESWQEPGIHPGRAPAWKRPLPNGEDVARILDRVPHRRLTVLTNDPLCDEVRALRDRKPRILPADGFDAWNWLRTCPRMAVVLCHPSDWWAAFLSNAREIYALNPWSSRRRVHCTGPYGCGWLGGRPLAQPDLHMPDPRYIYEW